MATDAGSGGAAVRLEAVHFAYGEAMPMMFDLSVEASARVALMGPSGSGKSTLLNLVAGFEQPAKGRVLIGGVDVTDLPPAARPVSMVFQENNLFAHLDAAANVGLGRSPALRLGRADREAVSAALSRVGLSGKEKRLPGALSGGERQRVALARVMVRDSPVLLLDEPFAGLGQALLEEMLDLIAALQAERGMTILLATHEPQDAARLCDTIAFLEEGRVAAVGPVREFLAGAAPEAFRRYVGARHKCNTRASSGREPS